VADQQHMILNYMTNSSSATYQTAHRVSVSVFFFIYGVGFSTWASRIPDIKDAHGLNDAELGTLLLVMPFSTLIGLVISSWMNRNFDNKPPMLISMFIQTAALISIGMASNIFALGISLFGMALAFRIGGIAMNTQAVLLQRSYNKPINGSFHALWSFGGIVGVGLTSLLINFSISLTTHLLFTAIALFIISIITYKYLPSDGKPKAGLELKFGKPDKSLFLLGLTIMFASFCEGGMFDWSGVYFKEVIKVEVYTAGYFTFMFCMALSRWYLDKIIVKVGHKNIYTFSSILIVSGVLLSTSFPFFIPAMVGFAMIGIGAAVVIPTTFLLAGDSNKYSPGLSIAIVSTYSIIGMLIGPTFIGFLSNAYGLRLALLFLAFTGACILPISKWYFRINPKN
jgi:MFS family permease